ncbi:9423_t:CDS:2 [Ambispora gerdemannii]|uniref:9423_t:CDS:1 n=1 Tax=Ambispora gerdemannii TaxID=144530 RepID=A0A9N8VVW1_9GLOM|nr:9423_t:CDS:2 [Ambispora gerdemannii]
MNIISFRKINLVQAYKGLTTPRIWSQQKLYIKNASLHLPILSRSASSKTSKKNSLVQKHRTIETFLAREDQNTDTTVYQGTLYEYETIKCLQEVFGIETRRCGGSNDRGVDFRGRWTLPDKTIFLIGQCKKFQVKSSPRHVRELEGSLSHESPQTLGIISSGGGFTSKAKLQFTASPWPLILMMVGEEGESCDMFLMNHAAENLMDGFKVTMHYEAYPKIEGVMVNRALLIYKGKPFEPKKSTLKKMPAKAKKVQLGKPFLNARKKAAAEASKTTNTKPKKAHFALAGKKDDKAINKVISKKKVEELEEKESNDSDNSENAETDSIKDNGDEEDGISLDNLSEEELYEDVVPQQRVTINNKAVLMRLSNELKLDLPWIETQVITSTEPVIIKDVNNDIERELAFYKQALDSATEGRTRILENGVPFSRPDDYFAEMVKSDEHMAKIRQKLLDETQRIKAGEAARRQRELKKFGKKVQVEKIQERQKQKTQDLEKIKAMKKKRKGIEDTALDDDFDIALEKAVTEDKRPNKRQKTNTMTNKKRVKKDARYGFGGKKRHLKSNTADSSGDIEDFNPKKMKGGWGASTAKPKKKIVRQRPGKARRQVARNKKR